MKNNRKNHLKRWWFCVPIAMALCLTTSCREDYILDEQEPTWLGASIYDYLKTNGNYTYYVRLIDDLGYTDVLSKTGSKTLFVVDDVTFGEFFGSNKWNVKNYEELSQSQKAQILYSLMLNNVFFSHMLGDIPSTDINENPEGGMCIRRNTAVPTVPFRIHNDSLPQTSFWAAFTDSVSLYMDNTSAPMVNFTEDFRVKYSMTGEDIAFINKAASYQNGDIFINGAKVVEANIKCKNGVVHRLERLALPLVNMAQAINESKSTNQFAYLLDRFSAPYYYTGSEGTDSIYVKKYFAKRGHSAGLRRNYIETTTDEAGTKTTKVYAPADTLVSSALKFDPGWNKYASSDQLSMEEDMAAIYVPSDAALDAYWNGGGGDFLREVYHKWENVPDDVLDDFINNHMKERFTSDGVPSKFAQVRNDAHISMGIEKEHIEDVMLCNNGVVYITNRVFPPVSYVAVSAPTLVNDNMKIMRAALESYGFLAYLHSMDSYYSFVLPTDSALQHYIDPISVAQGKPKRYAFVYNDNTQKINIQVYDGTVAPYPNQPTIESTITDQTVVRDRLEDLIDYHIIVDDIESGKEYYRTKGNGTVKVNSSGPVLSLFGGYQLEQGQAISVPDELIKDQTAEGNGKTYIVKEALMQPSHQSVYSALYAEEDFREFRLLMELTDVLGLDDTYASFGNTVKTFNTFHYTIYVPDNEAIARAYTNGLPDYETEVAFADSVLAWVSEERNMDYVLQLEQEGRIALIRKSNGKLDFDDKAYKAEVLSIIRDFVNYHIQDNSVYIGGGDVSGSFETATLDPTTNTFCRLDVSADNSQLTIKDALSETNPDRKVTVVKEEGKYNIMVRDYLFNGAASSNGKVTIDNANTIETSSFAVIHKISDALYYKDLNATK